MLVVFAPQALLYGLSVVLYGLLQSYRRFAAPRRAGDLQPGAHFLLPGLRAVEQGSSTGQASPVGRACVVGGNHAGHRRPGTGGRAADLAAAPAATACAAVPPGVARRMGGLALVGMIELIAIDLAGVVAIVLANGHGQTGALVIFNYASQVFSSISAVLALSIVISAFPVLSAREGRNSTRPAQDRRGRWC